MRNYILSIAFHWPHDRLALGWEIIHPNEEFNYTTVTVFLGIATLNLDIE